MQNKNKIIRAFAATVVAICLLLSFCSCTFNLSLNKPDLITQEKEDSDFLELELVDALFRAHANYDIDKDVMLRAVLKAYVEATGDAYAEYFTKEEYEKWLADSNAELTGIGVRIVLSEAEYNGEEAEVMQVLYTMENSPAEDAGILPGDCIYSAFDGEKYVTLSDVGYDNLVNFIAGTEGTFAKINVLRKNDNGIYELLYFEIERAKVETVSVKSRISETDPTIGIVGIEGFDLKTPYQFDCEMEKLISQGITKFVFDLRNNPGGDLASIIAVLSRFLDENDLIVSTMDKAGNEEKYFVRKIAYNNGEYKHCSVSENDIGKFGDYSYSVLVNKNTASAAELFTATLRDYEMATVVGKTTYGKGCIQSIYPLEAYGFDGAIKMTVGYYYPMSGVGYHGIGIAPSDGYEVDLDDSIKDKSIYTLSEAEDNQLQRALEAVNERANVLKK